VLVRYPMPSLTADLRAPLVRVSTKTSTSRPLRQTRQVHETTPWRHWDKRTKFFLATRTRRRLLVCSTPSTYFAFRFAEPETQRAKEETAKPPTLPDEPTSPKKKRVPKKKAAIAKQGALFGGKETE